MLIGESPSFHVAPLFGVGGEDRNGTGQIVVLGHGRCVVCIDMYLRDFIIAAMRQGRVACCANLLWGRDVVASPFHTGERGELVVELVAEHATCECR